VACACILAVLLSVTLAACGGDFQFKPSGPSRRFTEPERPLYATPTPEPTPTVTHAGV